MLEFVFDCSICSVLSLCSTVPPKPTMAPHVPSAKGERNSRVWKPRKGYPNSLWFQEKSWYTLDKKKCDMAESPIFNIYRIDRSGFGQEKKSSCRNYPCIWTLLAPWKDLSIMKSFSLVQLKSVDCRSCLGCGQPHEKRVRRPSPAPARRCSSPPATSRLPSQRL